jgi:hypothetical protein
MKRVIQSPLLQEETRSPEQATLIGTKQPYKSPQVVVYGTVAELTRGSGGNYDDECTSGKQPGDDE